MALLFDMANFGLKQSSQFLPAVSYSTNVYSPARWSIVSRLIAWVGSGIIGSQVVNTVFHVKMHTGHFAVDDPTKNEGLIVSAVSGVG